MKITILADNYVDVACLVAEHGFACLIEAKGKNILFDTGQGQALLNNMINLNIEKDIDMLVFSHGHYDHTGGLTANMGELAEYVSDVYASKYIFENHLKKQNGGRYTPLGFRSGKETVELKYNLNLNDGFVEIAKDIFLSGTINRYESFDADKLLYVEINGEFSKDMFRDEQYLVVKEDEGIHVITGCTHCGAVNLLKDVCEKFKGEQILSLTGGLHMFRSTEEQTEHVIQFLKNADVKSINTGHCTGLDAAMQMQQRLGKKVKITKAGMIIDL